MSIVGPSRVFVDSNVLYSRTLRDWLGLLSLEGSTPAFVVCWSEDVMAEVLYHLRRDNPGWPGHKIRAVRDRIAGFFEGGRVEEFEVDGSYRGKDTHDAHVHAAATACRADYLLTVNVNDFDDRDTSYEVIDPDAFFVLIHAAAPAHVESVTREQMRYWANKRDEAQLPEYLDAAGCPQFAELVRRVQARIGGIPWVAGASREDARSD